MKGNDIKTLTLDVRMMWSSGIGTYSRQLVPRVIQRLPEVRFCLLGRPKEMEQWKGFAPEPRVEWIEAQSPVYSLGEQWELARKIPRDTALFWAPHYNFPLFFPGRLMATVHDVFHLAHPEFVGGVHKRFYARFMFRRLVQKAESILCVSEFTRGELLRLAGGDEKKMDVVPNGVDDSWFDVTRPPKPERPYLLYVGNIKPHKNLGRLLEAFALLKDRFPQDLLLVGKKEGFLTGDPSLLRRAEAFGGRVRFTGEVNDAELKAFYAGADLLVFPSLYEGFGLPTLEAMACGCPVAVSKAASLPEVCGEAAAYFDPLDPREMASVLSRVLGDAEERKSSVAKGIQRAKEFSWEKSADRTVKVIRPLLGI